SPLACNWSVGTDVPWITITSSSSGSGNGGVSYSVATNSDATARLGNIVIGGRLITVGQQAAAPPPCPIRLWPFEGHWAGDGGSGAFDVTTTAGCSWTASTGASWIHVSTNNGDGSGTTTFTVSSNSGSNSRTGTIAVGSWPSTALYTITQDAV